MRTEYRRLGVAILAAAVSLAARGAVPAAARGDAAVHINYVAADAVYLDAGRNAGLAQGTRVSVVRGGKTVAVLEVVYVSSASASCRLVSQEQSPEVGDLVKFQASSPPTPAPAPVSKPSVSSTRTAVTRTPVPRSRVLGQVALEYAWQNDLGDRGVFSQQPGVSIRLRVQGVPGGGELRIRHRSRLYRRSRALGASAGTSEWAHRLTELGLVVGSPDADVHYAVGRVTNPYMLGMGEIDGGFLSRRVAPHTRVGLAAGFEPDLETTAFASDHRTAGAFVSWDRGSYTSRRFEAALALSGSYVGGKVDREFAYVQTTASVFRAFSVHQSMEVDLNRGWRRHAGAGSVTLSNVFITASATPVNFLDLHLSYDARRNVRNYATIDSPDSLFDNHRYTGYGGGLGLALPGDVRLRGGAGVRLRDDGTETNRYVNLSASVGNFPWTGHGLAGRLSVSRTPVLTGYRPMLSYHFPLGRRTRVALSGGQYIYERAVTSTSTFGEIDVDRALGRRYHLSGGLRRYSGGGIDSVEGFAELALYL